MLSERALTLQEPYNPPQSSALRCRGVARRVEVGAQLGSINIHTFSSLRAMRCTHMLKGSEFYGSTEHLGSRL